MSKYFIVSPDIVGLSDQEINQIEKENKEKSDRLQTYIEKETKKIIETPDNLIHTFGRVVIKINLEYKNSHTLSDGLKISLQRQFNNLNRRYTEPVNAIVISAEDIPKDAEILIHPNGIIDSNKIFDYKANDVSIGYYSIPREQCFIWRKDNEWVALPPFQTALRVFEPYTGTLENIEPTLLKNTLYVTSGNLKGKVVITIKASDYQIHFQDTNGRGGSIIRFRPDGDKTRDHEPEAIAVSEELTKKINNNELLIGYEISDAKTLSEWQQ